MGGALVVGLARSGLGAANLLAAMGEEVTVTDIRTEEELGDYTRRLSPGVGLALGGHPEGLFRAADLIVLSPGVPAGIEPLRRAREAGVEIISELELACRAIRDKPVYAITGTNGKSTSVTLLDLMLRKSGRKTLLAGNIGNAVSEEVLKRFGGGPGLEDVECVVLEVSSFQLEAVSEFRAAGAAILNITPDHMDRYASMEEYRAAKARIFINQRGEDFALLNADDPECMAVLDAMDGAADVFFFSREKETRGVCLKGGELVYRDLGPAASGAIMGVDEIRIKGIHNLENAMAASAMALLAGCRPGAVREALGEFPGLEHRLEFVRELDGVAYVNDSKGTNVGAVVKSLEGFDSPVVLIAGGRDKGGDFSPLKPLVREKVRALVLIGEASLKIKAALGEQTECYVEDGLGPAVRRARQLARSGDAVLLSPGCASFDMFEDFQDRGNRFKEIVKAL